MSIYESLSQDSTIYHNHEKAKEFKNPNLISGYFTSGGKICDIKK
jgi:hypothetical protein